MIVITKKRFDCTKNQFHCVQEASVSLYKKTTLFLFLYYIEEHVPLVQEKHFLLVQEQDSLLVQAIWQANRQAITPKTAVCNKDVHHSTKWSDGGQTWSDGPAITPSLHLKRKYGMEGVGQHVSLLIRCPFPRRRGCR